MKRRAIIAALLLAAVAHGQTLKGEAKPGSLYEITSDKPSAVIVQEPLGLEYRSYWTSEQKQVIVFCTGQHPRIVLVVFSNGEVIPDVRQYVIDVTPDPSPPNPPDPNPPKPPEPKPSVTGLAQVIRDEGRKLGISPTVAAAYAENYEAIATKIAAVASLTAEHAKEELIARNQETGKTHKLPRAAMTIEKTINDYLNQNGKNDRELYRKIFSVVAAGWRAI